jgi:hypothetical protein
MFWEAVFATDLPFNELDEIFLFVHDETKIEKIADVNLFDSDDFKEQLAAYQLTDTPIDTAELKAIAMLMQPSIPEPQPEQQPAPSHTPEQPVQPPLSEKKTVARASNPSTPKALASR